MRVNYVVESFEVPHYLHEDNPILNVLSHLMEKTTLHKEIREKGGAYGAGCVFMNDGVLSFYSYRDPHTLETYKVYE